MKCPNNSRHSVLVTMGNTEEYSDVLISFFCVKCGLVAIEGWNNQKPFDKQE